MFKQKHISPEHDRGDRSLSGPADSRSNKKPYQPSYRKSISVFWYGLIIGLTIGAGLAAVLSNM